MDYFICGPEAIKDSFGWPNWAPIQIEKLQMRLEDDSQAIQYFCLNRIKIRIFPKEMLETYL